MNKNIWEIIPTVSINGLEFGTDRAKVREILGKPKMTFKKTSTSVNTTDAYADYHVYYSADDKLEAIEFFGKNKTIININSRQIYPGTLINARETLPDLKECYGSYISKDSAIGFDIDENEIDSILIGCKDYYQ